MDNLISKKELLNITKISYGQLYRWKRMDIIPEDWFIKKSAPTGQETYFERDKILERIEFILSQKDKASLDDIVEMIQKKDKIEIFKVAAEIDESVVSDYAKEIFYNIYEKDRMIGNAELLILDIIESYLVKSVITLEEMKSIATMIEKEFDMLYKSNGKVVLFRKLGMPICIACTSCDKIIGEPNSVKLLEIDVTKDLADIKQRALGNQLQNESINENENETSSIKNEATDEEENNN